MIDALISGRLIRDPALKTGPSGKAYCNFLLSVAVGEEPAVIVSGIAFQEVAERIARLRKGDALSVTGSLKPSTWTDKQTGEEKHGLNVSVSACLSPYDVKKRRANGEVAPKREPAAKADTPGGLGFDDDIAF